MFLKQEFIVLWKFKIYFGFGLLSYTEVTSQGHSKLELP